ncbi:hypothetical protein [Leifsonia sp. NPDC080035]|uniref:Uncharacterized protein n=1 Tax=Leifsonia sp. NPDC080035 TaxID=3143936 RepID=A0AAU7GC35_9MICO
MTEERTAAIATRASLLAACVLTLVALGYALCFGVLWVCPVIVPSPEVWMTVASTDEVFRLSIANLLYWMVALCVAIALAVLITLLGARTLRALGELGTDGSSEAGQASPASASASASASVSGEKR